jgi:5-oxoprolinase (ATP-hydrolysing)
LVPDDIHHCPAVVGGNVEIIQRLTDCLLKAFVTMAASQGTMNNVLFGNENYGIMKPRPKIHSSLEESVE